MQTAGLLDRSSAIPEVGQEGRESFRWFAFRVGKVPEPTKALDEFPTRTARTYTTTDTQDLQAKYGRSECILDQHNEVSHAVGLFSSHDWLCA